jgi:hypothetical protein
MSTVARVLERVDQRSQTDRSAAAAGCPGAGELVTDDLVEHLVVQHAGIL